METPSFLSMFSAPIQATSCFLVPASLASQTEDLTRVAAAIFSQIMRPLFLDLYLFQVARRREYERLLLRSFSSLVFRRACSFWNLASAVAMCFMRSSDLPRNLTQARRRARAEPARASAACCFLRQRSILRLS